MLPYLLIGVALLAVLLLFARWFVNAKPATLVPVVKWIGGALAALAVLYLVFSGRAIYVLWFAPLALFLIRGLRGGRGFGGFGRTRPTPGQSSDVETEYLRMALDHDTGEMSGAVLKGRSAGRELDEMGLPELLALFEELLRADPRSAQLLETYLDRSPHEDWRERMEARERAARGGGKAQMTAEEARDILGVAADATPDEIKTAHRRLMQQNHPDRGGSTYLAAKINLAKETLSGA